MVRQEAIGVIKSLRGFTQRQESGEEVSDIDDLLLREYDEQPRNMNKPIDIPSTAVTVQRFAGYNLTTGENKRIKS